MPTRKQEAAKRQRRQKGSDYGPAAHRFDLLLNYAMSEHFTVDDLTPQGVSAIIC